MSMFFRRKVAPPRPTISWPIGREDSTAPPPSASTSSDSPPPSWYSSQPSDASTAITSYQPSTDSLSDSSCGYECHFNIDDYFDQFRDDLDISDDYPERDRLEEAGDVLIYDSEGNSRPFKTIYSGDLAIGEQQMVIFVRHFFCGACQAYLRALAKAITLQTYFTLPIPTSITIIGLGSPALISAYRRRTNIPFPIYADPTRKLYKLLGMQWTIRAGPRCDYMKDVNEVQWVKGQVKQVLEEDKRLRRKGGNLLWVGGEFMWRDGEVVWCHRMKTYRGHSEISVIKRLLGVED